MEEGYVLKLSERNVAERMLIASLSLNGSITEEWMVAVLTEVHANCFCRDFDVEISWEENMKRPLTEAEKERAKEIVETYRPYQDKTLKIGGKEYSIYNSNNDGSLMPCGKAPKIYLSDDEVKAWKEEFSKDHWMPFHDEVFLK